MNPIKGDLIDSRLQGGVCRYCDLAREIAHDGLSRRELGVKSLPAKPWELALWLREGPRRAIAALCNR